jgi:hypothetical protein
MAHLKLYLDGTPGGTDGEEITDATTLKGIMTNSHASYNNTGGAIVPICFRCEEGFKATNVQIVKISDVSYLSMVKSSGTYSSVSDLETFKQLMAANYFIHNSVYSSTFSLTVENTNVMIVFCISAKDTDSTGLTDVLSVSYVEDAVS